MVIDDLPFASWTARSGSVVELICATVRTGEGSGRTQLWGSDLWFHRRISGGMRDSNNGHAWMGVCRRCTYSVRKKGNGSIFVSSQSRTTHLE